MNQEREALMHAVIRSYSGKGSRELTSVLEKNKGEIEKRLFGRSKAS
jgi:hypothetical protein